MGVVGIFAKCRIDIEHNGHFDFLMRVEAFLVETEALDLVEIDAAGFWRDVERRVRDDRFVAEIFGGKEHQLLLAEVNGHGALFRLEAPRQIRRDVAVERDRHGLVGSGGRIGVCPLRRAAISGRAAECAVQFRRIGHQTGHDAERDDARHENIEVSSELRRQSRPPCRSPVHQRGAYPRGVAGHANGKTMMFFALLPIAPSGGY